jgi:two-component system sensor histidine kinase KdpD
MIMDKIGKSRQYLVSAFIVCAVSGICFGISAFIGYRVVAFILLVTVSLIAVVFDILPVLFTAVITALIWDFFFIPPHFTFSVGSTDDTILLLMYFVIAMMNAVLTYKIRQVEKHARQKEEKANTLKLYDTLLNSLSHELRTPIATIIGATDNLQSNGAKLTAENRDELVGEISKASLRLNQQVENLLNMSRLESGFIKPKKDWCDITEVVYEMVRRVEETEIAQKISINISPDLPLFNLDKWMLEQIIYNLLINAAIYTPAESVITISATCYTDVLLLIIEDNGLGFPNEEIDHVFDKFYRLKNARTGGTGLGLSIVRGFAEALEGSVELKNILPHGARFTIKIEAQTSYLKNMKNE